MSLTKGVTGMKRWRLTAALALALLGSTVAWVGDAGAARTTLDHDARGRSGGSRPRGVGGCRAPKRRRV